MAQDIPTALLENPMRDVEGKVAFITGGDSGIGLGIARAFARAGMKVVITYRNRDHLDSAMIALKDASDRVHAISVDVTDRTAMAAAAEETVEVFGKVNVLVNNAGVFPMVTLSSATFDDWDWCMGINVNGVFNGIRAFLPHIKSHREGGQIVATASMDGLVVGRFSMGLYVTAKFAVVGMMEALRNELAGNNIGVSVFCPGGVTSNIADGGRNRPENLSGKGSLDAAELAVLQECSKTVQAIATKDSRFEMDPQEAGERVLQGIRRNELYILSHTEYAQAIEDRSNALLASIKNTSASPTEARSALARINRNLHYLKLNAER